MTAHAGTTTRSIEAATRRQPTAFDAFHPDYRQRVAALAGTLPPVADLANSFPALLFALATDYGTAGERQRTLQAIAQGAPLREAAALMKVPWWLRRLPAQAFAARLKPLPTSAAFNERIQGLVPTTPDSARAWFWAVSYGLRGCHADFALWVAGWARRQRPSLGFRTAESNFRYMAAWAWHADHPDTPGARLLRRAWTPDCGLRRAVDELGVWKRRKRMALCIGDDIGDTWLKDGQALGYDFVALRTAGDFVDESAHMDNCLDQYADRLEEGRSRVFSIRRAGTPIADVEIGLQEVETGMPAVLQLRGPRNRRAGPEIWQATYAWLGAQPLRAQVAEPPTREEGRLTDAARAFWLPYIEQLDTDTRKEFRAQLSRDLGVSIGPVTRRRKRSLS